GEPAGAVERVDRRPVDHQLGDPGRDHVRNCHEPSTVEVKHVLLRVSMEHVSVELAKRVAVVTGGTKGIGRAIAERLLAAGAEVIVCARQEPARPLRGGEREALYVSADVRDVEQIDRVVATARERFGRLDLLVNNAGGSPPADAATASPRFS